MKNKVFWRVLLLLVCATAVGLAWTRHLRVPALPAMQTLAPSIDSVLAEPNQVLVSSTTRVTITARITHPQLITSSVNLLRLNSSGTSPTILGVMRDDGTNGDAAAGDRTFTLGPLISTPSGTDVRLQVSAAFQGRLQRVLSPIFTVRVVRQYANGGAGIVEALVPAALQPISTALGGVVFQVDSRPFLPGGGKLPNGLSPEQVISTGYVIGIQRTALQSTFDLNSWLQANHPYSTVASVQPVTVDGQSGFIVKFADELQAGTPTALVAKNGWLYSITYSSTYDDGSPEEAVGLQYYQEVIRSLKLQ